MTKENIVSGIQPSGRLHLGNYLGALKNWVEIQNSGRYRCWFFVADYHSLTEDYNPADKRKQILETAASYLAAGLDPKKSTVFIQSDVPECTELAWIFNTVTPFGELERMTQFKEKTRQQSKNINIGLFDYPVLQAADILLYRGRLVPVGQDQVQHLELTKKIARWFNNKYQTDYFPETEPLLTPAPKVKDLISPDQKMSKSRAEKHWLALDDSPKTLSKKIGKATTTPAGIANLKTIFQAFQDSMPGEFQPKKMSETKKIIAQGLGDYFKNFRKEKTTWLKNPAQLEKILTAGKNQAKTEAQKTIKEVKKIIGLK